MKTAISIEDDIFNEAEQTAKEMGLSRSKFYSKAILEYIQNHKYDAVTDTYNEIYSSTAHQEDIEIEQANFDLFNREEW
jgi:metal-responsive CopG/Arc/MetJ family transcriptional regulator